MFPLRTPFFVLLCLASNLVAGLATATPTDPVERFTLSADSALTAGGPSGLSTWLAHDPLLAGAAAAQLIDVAVQLGDAGDKVNEAGNIALVRALAVAAGKDSAPTHLLLEYEAWDKQARETRRDATALEARADSVRVEGNPDAAVELLLRADQLYEQIHDTHSRAVLYGSLGIAHWYRGDFEAVSAAYTRALELRRDVGDRILEGRTLNGMGSMNYSLGNFAEATRWYAQAAALRRKTGDLAGLGTSLTYAGHARLQLGQVVRARQLYEEALPVLRRVGTVRQVVENLIGTGDLYAQMTRYGDAIDTYREAIRSCEADESCEYTGLALQNLAATLRDAGEPSAAIQALERVEPYLDEANDPATAARACQNWARCALELGDEDLAKEKMARSIALARESGDAGLHCDSQAALASLYLHLGVFDRAETAADEALRLATEMDDPSRQRAAHTLLGGIALRRENGTRAVEEFSAALALDEAAGLDEAAAEDLLGRGGARSVDGDPDGARADLRRARSLFHGDTSREWLVLLNLADSFEETDADSAAFWYGKALAALDARSETTGGAAMNTGYLFADRGVAYEGITAYYARKNGGQRDGEWAAKAWDVAERSRARGLLELLDQSFSMDAGDSALAVIDSLYGIDTSTGQGRNEQRRLQRRLALLRDERLKQKVGHNLAATRPVDLGELQDRLHRGTVVFQYALGDDASWLWVIDRKHHRLIELPGRSELERHVRAFRDAIAQPGSGDASLIREGRWLYDELVAPARERIKKARQLVVVPDGVLFELPFEALLTADQPEGTPWTGQPFLGRNLAAVYVPSSTVYLQLMAREKSQPKFARALLAMGDADYSGLGSGDLEPLPWTRNEVEAIRPKNGNAIVLTAADASETRLRSSLREGPSRVIHLATHGLIDPREPAHSAIALSASDEDDGYLYSLEILSLTLDHPMIVLSACESAMGKLKAGEGVVGLTRSFLAAGAQGVVASLWPVSDSSTAALMTRFYDVLWRGKPAAEAMREARLQLMNGEEWSHPWFWAPFVVLGTGQMPW